MSSPWVSRYNADSHRRALDRRCAGSAGKAAVVRGEHATIIEGGSAAGRKAHKLWRRQVAAAAAATGVVFGDGDALRVSITFVMPRPKSAPKRLVWADKLPDIDKLLRALHDGLSEGGIFAHDQRIVMVKACKVMAADGEPTGADVTVEQLHHEAQ